MKTFAVILTDGKEIQVQADSYSMDKTGKNPRFFTNDEITHTFIGSNVVFVEEVPYEQV